MVRGQRLVGGHLCLFSRVLILPPLVPMLGAFKAALPSRWGSVAD